MRILSDGKKKIEDRDVLKPEARIFYLGGVCAAVTKYSEYYCIITRVALYSSY